jgi:hypothetical protein
MRPPLRAGAEEATPASAAQTRALPQKRALPKEPS